MNEIRIPEKKKKALCSNCGKMGHEFKSCHEPITSFGIINIKIVGNNNENLLFRSKFTTNGILNYKIASRKYPNIICSISNSIKLFQNINNCIYKLDDVMIPFENPEQTMKFSYYKNRIMFMMVSRRFSLGFIDFIRGKYEICDFRRIVSLFQQMYDEEIAYLKANSYDNILYYFLNKNNETRQQVLNRIYEGRYSMEYCESKTKFNALKNGTNYGFRNLDFYADNIKPKWKKPEWGFPKGRREKNSEENIECACREFQEETGYDTHEYLILNKIEPIEEVLKGTNGVFYKHVYYLSLNNQPNQNLSHDYDVHEIGDVKWFTYDEAMMHIRPYHCEKKQILTRVYLFMLNYLIQNVYDLKLESPKPPFKKEKRQEVNKAQALICEN